MLCGGTAWGEFTAMTDIIKFPMACGPRARPHDAPVDRTDPCVLAAPDQKPDPQAQLRAWVDATRAVYGAAQTEALLLSELSLVRARKLF